MWSASRAIWKRRRTDDDFDTSNERITYVEGKLTPSDEDFCKQDFKRDPSTSRARFYARYPTTATLRNWQTRCKLFRRPAAVEAEAQSEGGTVLMEGKWTRYSGGAF